MAVIAFCPCHRTLTPPCPSALLFSTLVTCALTGGQYYGVIFATRRGITSIHFTNTYPNIGMAGGRGPNKAVVRVYIVRHGETQENRDGIIQGQRDTALNEIGLEQARMVGEALKDAKLGIAFSSDLSRAVKTAEVILLHHPEITLHKREELRERGMGELEGRYADVSLGRSPRDTEPVSRMRARANSWWGEAVVPWMKAHAVSVGSGQGPAKGRGDVLIVSHGGLIGILLQALRRGTVRFDNGVRLAKCVNGSITVIEVDPATASGKIVRCSDISHLTGPMVEGNVDVQDAPPGE